MKAGIYKLTSPSGKIYIGQSIDLNTRLKKYKLLNCQHQIYIYNSIKKYGFENFKVDILWSTEDNNNIKFILNQLEEDFINLYDCLAPNGYNLREGGGSIRHSQETKNKIGKSNSVALKGRVISQEVRDNMSSAKILNKCFYKTVEKYDLQNNFIEEYESVKKAKELNKNCSKLDACARGERKSAGGFIWKYKKEMEVINE